MKRCQVGAAPTCNERHSSPGRGSVSREATEAMCLLHTSSVPYLALFFFFLQKAGRIPGYCVSVSKMIQLLHKFMHRGHVSAEWNVSSSACTPAFHSSRHRNCSLHSRSFFSCCYGRHPVIGVGDTAAHDLQRSLLSWSLLPKRFGVQPSNLYL